VRKVAAWIMLVACAGVQYRALADEPVASGAPAAGPAVASGGAARTDNPITGREITPGQIKAVERGMAWLAAHQAENGAFVSNKDGGGQAGNAGITALGALALMEGGSLPDRGPYGAAVSKALGFVLSKSTESGLIASDASPMYGHGFATLFLAEAYGMGAGTGEGGGSGGGGVDELREKLTRAVRLIERSQYREAGSKNGGWRYRPVPDDADISVTICQIMALRAARDAGIKVDKAVIDRAIAYIKRCQNTDGGFSYMAAEAGAVGNGGSNFARTSAGVASMFYAGIYDGPEITAGLGYLKKAVGGNARAEQESHFYYANYYGVQAMFLAGGDYWGSYYPMIRDQLIAKQQTDGSWQGDFTPEYATAMSLIILQVPNRYLPVYSGKGTGN
jgi:Squalene-hopene cyclase C-terminal domain/Prenyltransferase and squalene oxidase repeat